SIVVDDLRTAALFGRRLVPADAQGITRLQGGPSSLRIDGNAARQLPHVNTSRDAARVRRIEAGCLGAKTWRVRDHDREHSGLADIDGELCLAISLIRCVEPLDRTLPPDQPESRGSLAWVI